MKLSFSIDDVIITTGLGKTKIYQLINSGDLKARKVGKRTFILKDDLESFLNNLQTYSSKKGE